MTKITHLIPSLDTPQGLHEKRLAKELRIHARGRSDGAKNYPASDETQHTEIELSILTRLQQAIDQFGQWLTRRLKDIAKAVSERAPSEVERDYASPVEEARFEIARLRDERRDDLAASCEEMRLRQRELRHFQRENGLTHRSAAYPPKIYAFGAVSILLLAESLANFQLFAEASPMGALGGAGKAFSFALGNFFIGFVVIGALGLRYAGHVAWAKRLGGVFAILVGAAAAVVYNAYVAEYRESLRLEASGVVPSGGAGIADVWVSMVADPTGFLNTDQGPLLFLIGIAAVLIFAIEGLLLYSDRYPGYKPVDKAFRDADADFEAAKLEFRDAAGEIVEKKIGVIDVRLGTAETKIREAIDLLNQAEIEAQTAQQAALESRHVAQRLISAYRTENAAVRDTPPPAYFRRLPELDAELTGLPPLDLPSQREARLANAAALREEARSSKEMLRAMALAALEDLKADIATAEVDGERRARERMDEPAPFAVIRDLPRAAE